MQNTEFINKVTFPRSKSKYVIGYNITITEHCEHEIGIKNTVFLKQIPYENPIKQKINYESNEIGIYDVPKHIVHTEYYRIYVLINDIYINKNMFSYDSTNKVITLNKDTKTNTDDKITIECFADCMEYEFKSSKECSVSVNVVYDDNYKVGTHNIVL